MVNSAVAGTTDGTVFVSGYLGISDGGEHFLRSFSNGEWELLDQWVPEELESTSSLWANSDVVLGAAGQAWRYDLSSQQRSSLGRSSLSVVGHSTDSFFLLSDEQVDHFNGETASSDSQPLPWTDEPPLALLVDLGGPETQRSPNRTLAVGTLGSISQWQADEAVWAPALEPGPDELPSNSELNAAAACDGRIWAVSGEDASDGATTGGYIAEFNNGQWNVMQWTTDTVLLGVACRPDGTVYAVGGARVDGATESRVWKRSADDGGWTLHRVDNLGAFLWDATCLEEGPCYAVGTDNSFIDLDETVIETF